MYPQYTSPAHITNLATLGKAPNKKLHMINPLLDSRDDIMIHKNSKDVMKNIPLSVSINALYFAKNPRYRSIPIHTNRFPVPRNMEQKSHKSPVVFFVSNISVITEPVINRRSLIQISTYLKNLFHNLQHFLNIETFI